MLRCLDEKMVRTGRPHAWKVWAPVLLLLVCVAPVCGQVDEGALLAALGDDDFKVRQEATRQLLLDESLTQEQLDRLYVASETPEQRHRLLRVARHHTIRRLIDQNFGDMVGPGSMGLSHHVVQVTGPDGRTERTGVMAVMTLPGFPAYAQLEPGDVILGFAGEQIPQRISPTQFQLLIRAHKAGEHIDLEILRNGEPLVLDFEMCQGQALSEVYDTSGITLNEPYRGLWAAERSRMLGLLENDAGTQQEQDAPAADEPGSS